MTALYLTISVLGFVSSYTDIKLRKIKNIHLLAAILIGTSIYGVLATSQNNVLNYDFPISLMISIGIGLILYFTNTWGAGDAKLYIAFCFLMPINKHENLFPFTSITIFTNIFLISTLVLATFMITKFLEKKTELYKVLFTLSTLRRLIDSLFVVICLGWIVPPILDILLPNSSVFCTIFFMYISYHLLFSIATKKYEYEHTFLLLIAVGLAVRIFLNPIQYMSLDTILIPLKNKILYALSFHCLHAILTLETDEKKHMPFAPFIFLGTIMTNTSFLNSVLDFLKSRM